MEEKYKTFESALCRIAESRLGINSDLTSELKEMIMHKAKQQLIVEEMQRRIMENQGSSYFQSVNGLSYQPNYGAIFTRYQSIIEKYPIKQPKPKSVDKYPAAKINANLNNVL